MQELVIQIATLCGYSDISLTRCDIAELNELHLEDTASEYFSSCVPNQLIDRPLFQLFSCDVVRSHNRESALSLAMRKVGFVTFASEPVGDAVAVDIESGGVYVVPHDIFEGGEICVGGSFFQITSKNIRNAAKAKYKNIRGFLEHWRDELLILDRQSAAFRDASMQDPETTDEFGNQLLIYAIRDGDLSAVRGELQRGAKLEVLNSSGRTALGEAVAFGRIEIARTLLEKGADVNARGPKGETPLMIAARHANLELINLLLENGADSKAVDESGRTAEKLVSRP